MVVIVAVLLAVTGSNSAALAVEVAVISPSTVGLTVIVAVAVAPMASRDTSQKTTFPKVLVVPWDTVTDWICTLNGKAFVTVIAVAGLGPLFTKVTV